MESASGQGGPGSVRRFLEVCLEQLAESERRGIDTTQEEFQEGWRAIESRWEQEDRDSSFWFKRANHFVVFRHSFYPFI